MLELIQSILFSFAAIFPVLNPLGGAVIFLALTKGASDDDMRKLPFKVGINTFILLVVVLITGSWILRFFGISVPIVQVAGGLIVAYIGWTVLNQSSSQEASRVEGESKKEVSHMAFFPLTMPLIAGPGGIAVTLTIGAHQASESFLATIVNQLGAIIAIFLCAFSVFLCFRYANYLTKSLSNSALEVFMRLSAFINLCIGLTILWHGLQNLMPNILG